MTLLRSVLVVDDHPLFRAGFVATWRTQRPDDRIYEAGTYAEATALCARRRVDLVVADLGLPDRHGLDLCQWVREYSPETLVVVLSTHDAPAVVSAARSVGARGFFSKELPVVALIRDIERLLANRSAASFPSAPVLPALTARERDVLWLLMQGASNPMIAMDLGVSAETVKTHVGAIFGHLGASNRFHAVEVARALGFDVALPYLGDGGVID